MSGELLQVAPTCRSCGKTLTLDEMHYYASADGTATCDECEAVWLSKMTDWRAGLLDKMPECP